MAMTSNQIKKALGLSNGLRAKGKPETTEELKANIKSGKYNSSFKLIKEDLENQIRFDTFDADISSMGKTIGDVYGGWQTPETMKNTQESVDAMRNRLSAYDEYRRLFGKGTDMPDLSELKNNVGSAYDELGKLAERYSGYANANEYDTVRGLYGMSSDEVKTKWDASKAYDSVQPYTTQIKKLETALSTRAFTPADQEYLKNRIAEETKQRDEAVKKAGYNSYDELEGIVGNSVNGQIAYTTSNGKNIKWEDVYNDAQYLEFVQPILNAPDFNEKNVYQKKYVEYEDIIAGVGVVYRHPLSQYEDAHDYNYINKDEDAIASEDTKNVAQNNTSKTLVRREMSDEEIKVYNYVYNTQGPEKAKEFLSLINDDLKQRDLIKNAQYFSEYAEEDPVGSSVFSLISNASSGVEWLGDVADYAVTGEMDYNTGAYVTSTIRGTVSNNYDLDIAGWDAFDFVYNTTMSGIDSALATTTLGNAGGVALGLSAAAQGTNDALDRGLDSKHAFLAGLSSGANEMIFESVSIGNFTKLQSDLTVEGWKSLGKNIAKAMGVNASEEFFTEWANITYDNMINGELSQAETQIRAYMNSGISEEEAKKMVAIEQGVRMAEATASGAFMGLGFGGYAGVTSFYNTSSTGKSIRANGRTSDIFDIASNPEVGSAYETYTEYARKGINAENAKNAQIGRLYMEAESDARKTLNNKQATKLQKATALKKLGELSIVETENELKKKAKEEFNIGEETKVTKTGETVDTKNIKVEGDKITIATEKGMVSVDDVTLSERDAELAYVAKEIAKENGEDIANLFLEQYDGKTNIEAYQNSFNMVMEYAKGDFTFEEMMKNKGSLSATEVSKIYEETVLKTYKEQQLKIEKLIQDTADQKFYKGSIDESAITNKVWKKLDTRQRKAITFIKGLAKATGMNLVLTYNPNSKTGGSFNKTTNTITIDVAKFKNNIGMLRETIIPTMSHEMTHWMEEKSPELYRKLSDLVFSTLQEADGMSESTRLALEYNNQKAKGIEYSNKELRSEIVARACEDILSMSEQGQKLFDSLSESEKQTLGAKIKEILHNLMDMIQKMLGTYKSDTYEAKALQKYQDKLQEIVKIWDEMLLKSVEANQALEKSGVFEQEASADGKVLEQSRELQRKDPTKLTEEDFINILEYAEKKLFADGSYIPARVSTPQILIAFAKEQGYLLENYPLAMSVYKARQALSNESEWDGKPSDKPHNLTIEDVVEIVKAMSNPSYLVYQTKNDRFAEIVKFEKDGNKEKAYAIIDFFDVDKNPEYMNGYEGGKYNILVTIYPSENSLELKHYLDNKNNVVMTGQEMKKKALSQRGSGSYVPSHLNDMAFYTDSISDSSKNVNTKFSDRDYTINTSMTMDEAKQMIQRAFVLGGIEEWYEGEYKNGDEWLRGAGASEVALYIENEYTLTEKYLNKIQSYIDGDFYVEDILEAYLKGTLVGKEKPKTKRLDISKEYRINDKRFYSPQRIKDAKKLLQVATQRVTDKNRQEVSNARAKILLFAHNKGASELLGMTQAELNKKLRAWSNYSAKARDISKRFNNGVADSNKWTGIENCSWLYKGIVTTKDLESLVKDVKGASSDYEKMYIARTMLALDTHIDWSWLSFEFDTYNNVNKGKTFSVSKCLGYYTNESRKIVVSHDKPHTVAHEMGHALDYQWARDLGYTSTALTEVSRLTEKITDAEEKQFFENFRIFLDSLTDNGDIRNEYVQNPKEVFARFVARFVQWVDNTGTGRNTYNTETSYYNDKFTASHYIEFVKLLQEKAMLDSRKMEAGTNENVKFADRDNVSVYDIMGERDRILKENEQFRKEIENLKERVELEKKVTNGTVLNNNSLLAAAAHLRNIANSNMDKVELAKALKEVYSFILNSKELTWDEVFSRCYGVADQMYAEMKPTVEVNEFYKSILADIKKTRVSFNESQKMEARHAFDKNWNRYFFGRITLTNDGIPLESMWADWSQQYPDIFRADINDGDMVRELYDVLNGLQSASETVMEYNEEETKRYLAQEIYNQYWNVSTIKTTADKYDKQIKLLKSKHRNYMAEVREDYKARMDEKLKAQHKADKEKANELYKNLRERKDKEIALAKERGKERLNKYKDNAERKTRIQRITANVLSLNEMLVKNSKDKHVPEILKGPVITLIQSIDFSSKRMLEKGEPTKKDISFAKALGKVKDMMVKATNAHDDLMELYGHGLDEEIEKMVEHVDALTEIIGDNELVLNRMSLIDLQTLDKMVKTIKHAVNKMNKFHTVNHAKGIANLSQESVEYLDSLGKGKIYDGLRGGAKKLLDWGNALPYYVFKRFGSGGMKVYEALQDGWDKFAFNVKKIIDYTNSVYTSKEVKEWSEDVKTFKIKIPTDLESNKQQYQTVQMTVPQIMSMYCLAKREQAKGHLFGGGIRVADFKNKKGEIVSQSEGIIFTESDILKIFDSLTDRQKEVADKLQRFMNTICSDWGNEVSMARFGYKAFGEDNYFPIQSDDNNLSVNAATEQPNSLFKLLNMAFTKSTIEKANNRIIIGDIFDVFAQHTSDMAKYNALALPVLDSFKWYNYKEKLYTTEDNFITKGVKQSIENAFGKDGKNYFTTFLKDINGSQEVSRDTLGKGFFSNAKIAAVGMNLRVMLLQPTSYVRASAVIDNKYLLKALGHKPKIKRAETHCGIALWKSMGYYDTNIQRGVEAQIKHNERLKDKITDLSMKGAEWADKVTWGYLWNACELEIRDTRKDLKVGSEEFYTEIGKRLREVIYTTQVVDSTMTRSQMMRSSDGRDKMLTAFASEPTLAYNMLQDAYMGLTLDARRMGKKEAWKKNGKKVARTVAAYTMTNALAALIESAFDAYRDDDDEEMDMLLFMKYYFSNFASDMSIGSKIPYVKELYSFVQGFGSSRSDTQWMENMTKAITTWYKIFNGKKNAPTTAIKYSIKAISDLSGLPFYNFYRDTMATLDKFKLFTADDLNEMFKEFLD